MTKNFINKTFPQHYIEIVTKTREGYYDPYYKGILPWEELKGIKLCQMTIICTSYFLTYF
jgi:hypothetical protein